ncbi:zinc ribbon domain-containing protein [Thiomicrorhabdus sp. ZW0627]|uniref:zinc ribbon domain-containing protein n=1 Tax=unclassified Thiomicrorhabdus TaxID=2636650 RepID=UPI002436F1CA|nr:zinc ribbon domain-containing protein [Thiomicrorhabdus sp. ZW0627]MDG6773694.1 zinc ribbon domain-containing protein [Thiomicrorhabdus sp. ZW0627]
MPVYDYKCPEHGIFFELATMEDSAKPMACPHCSTLAPRVLVLPPELFEMDPNKKEAIARNEKAQYEPQISNADTRAENEERLKHKKGCGCQHHKRGSSKLMWTADGKKMFPSMRPWMISH